MFASHQLPFADCAFGQSWQNPLHVTRQQRTHLRKALRYNKLCFASNVKPPVHPVDLPEPVPRSDSAEIRRRLEQLYQLDIPSSPLWYSSSLVQQVAKYALLGQSVSAAVQLCEPPRESSKLKDQDSKRKKDDFYANVGSAIRTLREETPLLFQQDLTYDIYRDDIVFTDTRNTFRGKKNYSTIFWSLRFHGKLFFSRLRVNVSRIWQPEESLIRLRWTVRGVPRVPWEAEGVFDGISEYKLDSDGKIYEHKITNVQLRDPPFARSPLSIGLNLIPSPRVQGVPQAPCPGAFCKKNEEQHVPSGFSAYLARFSWVRMYAALLGTVQLLGRPKATTVLDM